MLRKFLSYVICGTDKKRGNAAAKKRRVDAFCADMIYSATSGMKKPAKHFKLGLAVKSIAGSRKMVDILNRL